MKLIRRSMIMCCLLVFLVCTTHVLTSGNAENQKTSKKNTNTLERIPDPKMEEIRRIRREDWPNPIVIVNADSFYLILRVDGRRREELNLADLEKTLTKTRSLASWASRRGSGERFEVSGGQRKDLREKQRSTTHVGIAQSDDRALAIRLVAQGRIQQSLAADVAIACFSSNLFPSARMLIARRS
jgi:hypothetical protein